MTDLDALRQMYETLAERYGERGETLMRDSFLVLAADIALASDKLSEAERLRSQLLIINPQHLLAKHPTFAAAAKAMDVRDYIADLRTQYPPERVEELLHLPRETPTVRISSETLNLTARAAAEAERAAKELATSAATIPLPPPREDEISAAEEIPHQWVSTSLAVAMALFGVWLCYVSLLRPLFRG